MFKALTCEMTFFCLKNKANNYLNFLSVSFYNPVFKKNCTENQILNVILFIFL